MSSNIKIRVQSFGRFLSNMVMPNIGAFIAWGFITALFIPTGWLPNETLGKLVGPMITYLLPLLIGYSGGRLIYGERGAVVGAITTMGIIVGAEIPMFLGAMIVGPLGGWAIKKVDKLLAGKVRSGFEMLVNNFSAGVIGMLGALLSFSFIGSVVTQFSNILASGVQALVNANLLPLTSILVEPAKILFLNNAINHGIFSPLGIQQSTEFGKSIFFLIEANPGPGLGILLAYMFFGKGTAKQTASSAAIIHLFGGIHEIYFPYVLMNPRLLLAVILGGMSGVFTLTLFNAGLVSPASPGSIFAVLLMAPKGAVIGVLASVIISCLVTFAVAFILLKSQSSEISLEEAQTKKESMKLTSGSSNNIAQAIECIYVACDAGMGSSAMGASLLRKKLAAAGLNIEVQNIAINDLPQNAELVITHQDLTQRAKKEALHAQHLSLTNFLDNQIYDELVKSLLMTHSNVEIENDTEKNKATKMALNSSQIFLNLTAQNKEEAIQFVGEQLVKLGFATPDYIAAMFEREKQVSTYLGEGVAIPHGTIEAKEKVLKTGIVFCQYPKGVRFTEEDDGVAKLVIGIAAKNNDHLQVVNALTNALDDVNVMKRLAESNDLEEILSLLSKA